MLIRIYFRILTGSAPENNFVSRVDPDPTLTERRALNKTPEDTIAASVRRKYYKRNRKEERRKQGTF